MDICAWTNNIWTTDRHLADIQLSKIYSQHKVKHVMEKANTPMDTRSKLEQRWIPVDIDDVKEMNQWLIVNPENTWKLRDCVTDGIMFDETGLLTNFMSRLFFLFHTWDLVKVVKHTNRCVQLIFENYLTDYQIHITGILLHKISLNVEFAILKAVSEWISFTLVGFLAHPHCIKLQTVLKT